MSDKTKNELKKDLKKLTEKNEFLLKENEMIHQSFKDMTQTSDNYRTAIVQLQNKLQEVANIVSHYEKTILVMSGRIQEKDTLISEQRMNIEGGKIE